MGKPNQRKLAKQKKKQKEQRKRHVAARESTIQPYRGGKYRSDELVPLVHRTEIGIFEAYESSQHTLNDHTVDDALCDLIMRLRRRPLDEIDLSDRSDDDESPDVDQIQRCVLNRWETYFDRNADMSRDELIGVLRTILHSVRVRASSAPDSQLYLKYLVGFLARTGVTADSISRDESSQVVDVREFLKCGMAWIQGHVPEAREEFFRMSQEFLDAGHALIVVYICKLLVDECPPGATKADLATEWRRAERLATEKTPS